MSGGVVDVVILSLTAVMGVFVWFMLCVFGFVFLLLVIQILLFLSRWWIFQSMYRIFNYWISYKFSVSLD